MNKRFKILLPYYILLAFPLIYIIVESINNVEFILYYILIYKTLIDGIFICYFRKEFSLKHFIPIISYLNNKNLLNHRRRFIN